MAGTVSDVEAAIHCGDELWFGVGMGVRSGTRIWLYIVNRGRNGPGAQARGFGSVAKQSTANPGIVSSIPPHSN